MTKIPIHKIKKITVNKSDEVALVVEKIIDADAKEVVLSIPRFSQLADSLSNFHLIKREAALLRKKVVIESVDDKVIELAGVAGLDSWNPILSRTRRQFSDIISARQTREEFAEEDIRKKKLVESVAKKPTRAARRVNWRRFAWPAAGLTALAGLFFLGNSVLPKADIKIARAQSDWAYNDSIRAEKLATVDPKTATIPAQIFTEKQSLQMSFPASGKKVIQQKASGNVIVYNAYSSDPQPLVATTRFVTPEGKIFRLSKSIVVPGAKIVEGQIIPSTLAAAVVADQPGADYNIGPVGHFTIPGFKGTPKYAAFYAESKEPMAGGFVGEAAYPTDSDIKQAKSKIAKKIEDTVRQKILSQVPADFKIIDGASSFTLLKENIVTEPNSSGTFLVAADAQISEIAFREADVFKVMAEKIKKDKGSDYEIKSNTVSYGNARADFSAGRLGFPVNFKAAIAKHIDTDALKQQVKGKSEGELRSLIYSLPDLQSVAISFWPFWVKSVPQNEAKISISVD